MKFEMWSFGHFLYILSPFIILTALYFLLRDKDEKLKYWVGVAIGIVSLTVIAWRNIDITINNGFDPQAIPLQVCHFGNIIVFLALVLKNKTLAAIGFTFNFPFALASLIEAEALAGYGSIWEVRAQAYIWGHLFIVLGAVYPVLLNTIRFKLKHVLKGMVVVAIIFVVAMLMNILLNGLGWNMNYFYAFDSGGVPFKMFENLAPKLEIYNKIGTELFVAWDWMYTFMVTLLGAATFFIMYYASRPLYKLAQGKDVGDGKKVA